MANDYKPWLESGETELEYFRRRFLEEGARVEAMERRAEAGERLLDAARKHLGQRPHLRALIGKFRSTPIVAAAPPVAPAKVSDDEDEPNEWNRCEHCAADLYGESAPLEPPPLPAEVQRVMEAAEDYYIHQQEPAAKLPEEADKVLHWMEQIPRKWQALSEAVAALRASREKGGSGNG